MAVSLAFMIKAVFFLDTKLLELRWTLLPQSDNNWISTHQPTSQSSSLAFHYAPVILTISWPLEHTLHSKICCPFETLHLFFLQLDISTQIFNISVTWRINRAKRSASNVAHYMATNLVLSAGELISSSQGPLHSAAWVFSKHGGWLLLEWAI